VAAIEPLRRELQRWLIRARAAGLDDEAVEALFATVLRVETEGVA
jgi:GntR family transcriptional regulator